MELKELLKQVSRSFYLTMVVLPRSVRGQISIAYLLARATDTIADTELINVDSRIQTLFKLRNIILEEKSPEFSFPEEIDWKSLLSCQKNSSEKILLENISLIIAECRKFSLEDQKDIYNVLNIIISGQLLDLEYFLLQKGKEHFVCEERLNLRIAAVQGKRKNTGQKEALDGLLRTFDLDMVSGLSTFDRRMVCVPKRCPSDCSLREQCRYQNFVRQAVEMEYDIQICNHNYLLADAIHRANGYRPLLKTYQVLIIDEAHKLPETAQQMYGKRLGKEDIAEICTLLEQEKYTHTAAKLKESFRQLFSALVQEEHETGQAKRRAGWDQERISFQPDVPVRRALKNCIRLLKKA